MYSKRFVQAIKSQYPSYDIMILVNLLNYALTYERHLIILHILV